MRGGARHPSHFWSCIQLALQNKRKEIIRIHIIPAIYRTWTVKNNRKLGIMIWEVFPITFTTVILHSSVKTGTAANLDNCVGSLPQCNQNKTHGHQGLCGIEFLHDDGYDDGRNRPIHTVWRQLERKEVAQVQKRSYWGSGKGKTGSGREITILYDGITPTFQILFAYHSFGQQWKFKVLFLPSLRSYRSTLAQNFQHVKEQSLKNNYVLLK